MIGGAAAVVAVVLFVVFLVGITVGIAFVIAMSVRRARAVRPDQEPAAPRRPWPDLDEEDPDDDEPGEPPVWPTRGS